MKVKQNGARTLSRGLDILELLAKAPHSMGVTELAESLELDKSTVHRLLTTLTKRGYARQDTRLRRYTLGAQALVLHDAFQAQIGVQQLCRPLLREMTDITGETSHLAILSGANIVFLDWICTPEVMGVRTVVGRSEPIHCTALGKALLAALPEEERKKLLQDIRLTAYTDKTPVTLAAVEKDLQASIIRGWTLDNEEFLLGVRCLAAVVLDSTGYPVAALGISGPATRLTMPKCRKFGPQIGIIARRASNLLGYRAPTATED